VFSHGESVWLLQMNVLLAYLDCGLNGTASLPDTELTAIAGHAVHTRLLNLGLWTQPEKSTMAKHSTNLSHHIQLQGTTILSIKHRYMD
jgi:hypothetical protein